MNAMRLGGNSVPEPGVLTAKSPVPILIVDDNSAKRLGLKAVLAPLGYLIVEADSGTAALRCVLAQDFAVILLDVCMPVMDGFETAALIRQRHQSEMTPIIFITAFKSDELRSTDLYAEGAVDFIFAPVPPDELRAKVSVFANLFLRAEELATKAREVQASADQLRLLTDAAPIGIFQTDEQNRYVYTNPRWTQITGLRPEQAFGLEWDTIMGPQERAAAGAGPGRGRDAAYGDELCQRFEIPSAEAPSRIVLLTSKCIRGQDGGVIGWVGTLADVTAEVGAEAAMAGARDDATEASRLKSDFLANMSHEIRTPMNGVIGMTDLLLESDLDPRQRDYAQTVRNSGEALLTIINDILDFSKIEAGKLEVEEVEFDVRAVVDDVVDLLGSQAQAKGLELVAVTEHTVPDAVSGDPGRVRQVLTNLVGNAIKFTSAGEVVVRTRAEDGTDPETVIRLEVSDTGDGIAPDKIDVVFQPFVQADTSTSRKYGGTGLGLAISSHLVSLMGGTCGVASRLGEGSTFWFTIAVHPAAARPVPAAPGSSARLAGVPVLIVDDNATQRSVLSDYLTGWGMTVATAETGEAALATLRAAAIAGRAFEVALVDRSMPGMDGLELKDSIVSDPALTARVVLMTGLAQVAELGLSAASGVCASLSKPVHQDDLRACLEVAVAPPDGPGAPTAATMHRPAASQADGTARLLLAEDNLINQKVAEAMLSSGGYEVDLVLNGAAAVLASATRDYDAILMDCQMPELNGYEATAAIRAREGNNRHTPIIALTAGARREDRDRCLVEGMDGYLAKPLNKDALLALVGRFVTQGALPAEITIDPAVVEELRLLGEGTASDFFAGVLDTSIVERLDRLGESEGEDLFGNLALLFLADATAVIVALRNALNVGDGAAVVRWAHALSGASANLGATELARLCAVLEAGGAAGHKFEGSALLEAVETELGRVRDALGARSAAP
jgi:PAS domain S-box-containing protein